MYVLGARRHVRSGLHPPQCAMRVVTHVAMGTLQTSGLSLVAPYAGIRERSEAPFNLSAPPPCQHCCSASCWLQLPFSSPAGVAPSFVFVPVFVLVLVVPVLVPVLVFVLVPALVLVLVFVLVLVLVQFKANTQPYARGARRTTYLPFAFAVVRALPCFIALACLCCISAALALVSCTLIPLVLLVPLRRLLLLG